MSRLERFSNDRTYPFLLLLVVLLAHGLLFLRQGYYWDDFPITWIAETYGTAGLARYFSTNRPIWGLLYQFSAGLGNLPWVWQLFGLFWRWLSALIFWLLLRQVWQDQPRTAALAGLALAVYPAFGQQAIGRVYGHFFWVMTLFFFSLYAGVRALQAGRGGWGWFAAAFFTSLINLLTLEYFFLLELARPLFYAAALRQKGERENFRLSRVLLHSAPFMVLFAGAAVWRAFFFPYQTNNYAPLLFQNLQRDFWGTLLAQIGSAAVQIRTAAVLGWMDAFRLPSFTGLGRLSSLLYGVVLAGCASLTVLILQPQRTGATFSSRQRAVFQMLVIAAFWLLLAGVPFYVTGLPVRLEFPNDRFTLAFLPGVALLAAAVVESLPLKAFVRLALAALLIGFSGGRDFMTANDYRRDWELQKNFFWQLVWRAPGLEKGTILMTNDLPLRYYSDNSLTAPLNWIYAPQEPSLQMAYHLLYPAVRLGSPTLSDLSPGKPVHIDYLAATFSGSTDRVVVLYFQPPGCLRVVDGEVERDNLFLPALIREAAANLSSSRWIVTQPEQPAQPPAFIYGNEPAHGWCYYYQKADLARQQGNWQQAAALGDEAFSLKDYPNDPAERMPFIEAYAQVGRWQDALEHTRLAADISPTMQPVLCRLWQRIDRQTKASPQKAQASAQIADWLNCDINP
ncbi:hypothetical protein [Bellilinea sp.]|uniref:tetratricopeptide repeat protein n=1 Tax=Bellilinea sp. TaxID=2838785 RepID=UPI002ADDA8A7|nr:hypothetical protein [Bellilinea sp.]